MGDPVCREGSKCTGTVPVWAYTSLDERMSAYWKWNGDRDYLFTKNTDEMKVEGLVIR